MAKLVIINDQRTPGKWQMYDLVNKVNIYKIYNKDVIDKIKNKMKQNNEKGKNHNDHK